ncbi:GGDEF domain-containing protein [Candidatus Pantoea persica]|uniref:GGDEF domain-containing protein n=1 Tax=Candidatus Pantoea persica TaxID=2518128 RepID=UPI002867B7E2|nr:diguanylate cyclase [Candidatus Pantoea persica]
MIYLSACFQRVTGHRIADWTGAHLDQLLTHPSHSLVAWLKQQESSALAPLRCQFMSAQGERRIGQLVVKTIWHQGRRAGFRGTVSNITQGMEAEACILFLSCHDALTGLSNRLQLREFLTRYLEPPHQAQPLAIVSLDLDQIAQRHMGTSAGDWVLNQMAQRRAHELAARLGDNEFALVMQESDVQVVALRPAAVCVAAAYLHRSAHPLPHRQHRRHLRSAGRQPYRGAAAHVRYGPERSARRAATAGCAMPAIWPASTSKGLRNEEFFCTTSCRAAGWRARRR